MYIASGFIAEYRESRGYSIFSSQGWWLNMWPFWGWIETFLKVFAWLFVFGIRSNSNPSHPNNTVQSYSLSNYPAFRVQVIIMTIACIFLALAILDRLLLYREVISMIFVFPNNLAHWTVLKAMIDLGPNQISHFHLRAFLWLMFLGDISKLIFFKVHDFNIKAVAKHVRH